MVEGEFPIVLSFMQFLERLDATLQQPFVVADSRQEKKTETEDEMEWASIVI